MTPLNWLGFAVCLCGISLHVGLKACKSKSKCLLVTFSYKIWSQLNENLFFFLTIVGLKLMYFDLHTDQFTSEQFEIKQIHST